MEVGQVFRYNVSPTRRVSIVGLSTAFVRVKIISDEEDKDDVGSYSHASFERLYRPE